YNIEPFRGSVRQGDWKLVWKTFLPSSVELYNLAKDPSETKNVAAEHPDTVAALQKRIESLAKESAKPLFLVDQFKVIMTNMNGGPILPTDADFAGVEEPYPRKIRRAAVGSRRRASCPR